MNPDSKNFDSLQRLLALKRHEQPPPGYFNRFSRDVIARIKAGENGASFELAFWERLLGLFDVKPVFAGAFGMAVCALLVSGVIASENSDNKLANPSVAAAATGNPVVATPVALVTPRAEESGFRSSTNPVAPDSLFNHFQTEATPVSWTYSVPQGN